MTRRQAQNKVDENYRLIRDIVRQLKSREKELDEKRARILTILERILLVVGYGDNYKEGIKRLDTDGYRAYADMLSSLLNKMNVGTRDINLPDFGSQYNRRLLYQKPETEFRAAGPVHAEPENENKEFIIDPDKYDVRATFSIANNDKLIFYIKDKQTGKEEKLFEIPATNNQKPRKYPTRKGDDPVPTYNDKTNEILYTTPNNAPKHPYIPGKFPSGKWEINDFKKTETEEDKKMFGPYKIRTNAKRKVNPWEYVLEKDELENEKRIWVKKDVQVEDNGLLIHGGGYTINSKFNPKENNKYEDNTEGCIRIRNEDVLEIVKKLQVYLDKRNNIELKVE